MEAQTREEKAGDFLGARLPRPCRRVARALFKADATFAVRRHLITGTVSRHILESTEMGNNHD